MGVHDPAAWVKNVERLYRANDAAGVADLYLPSAQTRVGSRIMTPAQVHEHPHEWFGSLSEYRLSRTFRAATGDIIVSETVAEYVTKSDGVRRREFGTDIYWVDSTGHIYHKHTVETVQPYRTDDLDQASTVCLLHGGD